MTRSDPSGSGEAPKARPPKSCRECVYWHRPPTGVPLPPGVPATEGAIYATSGFCRKDPPGPSTERRPRVQWSVTHESFVCHQGKTAAELLAAKQPLPSKSCRACTDWFRPPTGVVLPDEIQEGEVSAYSVSGGYCRHGNPHPGSETSRLVYHPITLRTDWCGAGRAGGERC